MVERMSESCCWIAATNSRPLVSEPARGHCPPLLASNAACNGPGAADDIDDNDGDDDDIERFPKMLPLNGGFLWPGRASARLVCVQMLRVISTDTMSNSVICTPLNQPHLTGLLLCEAAERRARTWAADGLGICWIPKQFCIIRLCPIMCCIMF